MEPLLHIENLSLDFIAESGSVNALKNITLTVNKGEVVALVGESGSGNLLLRFLFCNYFLLHRQNSQPVKLIFLKMDQTLLIY